MAVLLLLLPLLLNFLWLLQQGHSNSLVFQTYALFLSCPPLHELSLSLQLGFLCLYVPKRSVFLLCRYVRPALQLLDLRERDWHAGRGLRDGLCWR